MVQTILWFLSFMTRVLILGPNLQNILQFNDSDLNELIPKRFSSESDAVGLQATAGSATLSAAT